MLFGELIKTQSWLSVEATLMLYFPDYQSSMTGFRRAFQKLQTIEPQPNPCKLKIKHTKESGVEITAVNKRQACSVTVMPWADVLGMLVDKTAFTSFSHPEIVAFVLWEITYYGFDEETIKKKTDEWLKELK